jgi:hypothetical protein
LPFSFGWCFCHKFLPFWSSLGRGTGSRHRVFTQRAAGVHALEIPPISW